MGYSKNSGRTIKRRELACALSAIIGLQASVTVADEMGFALEEIIVTAQKREQSMNDVPIAITAALGEDVRASGITALEGLAPSVPNFSFAEAQSGSDQIYMRGIGSGVNMGLEMAVGQVIDGVFYGRSRFGRAGFLDVERVEVLKGPQGALVGKNTSAGAINITTAKPTDDLEGWMTGTYEAEGNEGYTVEGAVSGPLTDTLKGRLAVRVEDRDGFMENTATGDDEMQAEDFAARGTLLWEASDNLDVELRYTYGESERDGRNVQLIKCSAGAAAFLGAGEDCQTNDKRSTLMTAQGEGDLEGGTTDFETVAVTVNWDLETFTLTSITGYAGYEVQDFFDPDMMAAELTHVEVQEDFDQVSQELRIVSNLDGDFDYIAGLYLQSSEVDSLVDGNSFPLPAGPLAAVGIGQVQYFNLESETAAIFAQLGWNINDEWKLTGSVRYTHEEKEMDTYTDTHSGYDRANGNLAAFAGPSPFANTFSKKADRSENAISPTLNLQWRPMADAMYYAKVGQGFKGGSFNGQQLFVDQASADAGALEYEEEEVLAFELGAKLTLLDGTMQLNAAAFYQKFDDLQTSALLSNGNFVIGNAGTAISQGLEFDVRWRVSEPLTLGLSGAWLDAHYDEYEDAQCHYGQTAAQGCITTAAGSTQDLSDETMHYAPEYSFTADAEYVIALGDSLELTNAIRVYYSDGYNMALDLDPNTVQDAYTKLDARITLSPADGNWEVALIGKNLTDETTINFASDVVTGNPAVQGSYYGFTEAPRSFALQGTYRY